MRNNYNTEQRVLIEEFLVNNSDKFVSSKDILDYLKNNELKVGFTTIYRYLNILEENNQVRVDFKNHTKYYQYITNECTNHFHLKCKECGQVIHLNCKEFEQINNHIIHGHNFRIDNNTIIYGLCGNCE